jgi:hypothetical protein
VVVGVTTPLIWGGAGAARLALWLQGDGRPHQTEHAYLIVCLARPLPRAL